jgi:hypothetical protein
LRRRFFSGIPKFIGYAKKGQRDPPRFVAKPSAVRLLDAQATLHARFKDKDFYHYIKTLSWSFMTNR